MSEEQALIQSTNGPLPVTKAAPSSSRPIIRKRTIVARVILVILFSLGIFLSLFPWGKAAVRAAFLLPALVTASEPAPLVASGDSIRFTRTSISSRSGPVYLDIYEPATPPPPIPGKREGVINIIGVGDNRADPQLINLSRSMARSGLVVVDMGTPTLFDFKVSTQDSDAVVQTVNFLSHRSGVDPRRIGIIGFSAGGPLACFAAADPRIRDQLAFITLFGSYFDTLSLLRDFGSRAVIVNGHSQPWKPLDVPLQVLANVFSTVLPPDQGSLLTGAFASGGSPLTPDELALLSPAATAAYHLLLGDQPSRVEQNLAALSPAMRNLLSSLSPSTYLDQIHTPIYLLHDRTDQYLPFTQSREFAATLARVHHPYDFAEFGIFQHVEVRADPGLGQLLGDGTQLFRILSKIVVVGT